VVEVASSAADGKQPDGLLVLLLVCWLGPTRAALKSWTSSFPTYLHFKPKQSYWVTHSVSLSEAPCWEAFQALVLMGTVPHGNIPLMSNWVDNFPVHNTEDFIILFLFGLVSHWLRGRSSRAPCMGVLSPAALFAGLWRAGCPQVPKSCV